MSSKVARLVSAYRQHLAMPWQPGLAAIQRVIFVVYDKTDELRLRALRVVFGDFRDAVVEQAVVLRRLAVDVAVQHGGTVCFLIPEVSFAGQQRDGEVVPAVARVEQAVAVVLGVIFARKEHQQAARYGVLDALD